MPQAPTKITPDDLAAAARVKVFFGHQSVGMNLIDGAVALFAAHGLPAPEVIQVDASDSGSRLPGGTAGFLAHAYTGHNDEPLTKIRDFETAIRGGLAKHIDMALMKFCYVDVTSETDVAALFQQYRSTLAALERGFPEVEFLHVTTPLTAEPGLKGTIKRLLGRAETNRADNVARERMNGLMREEYPPDRLFDLAAVESTAPDGTRMRRGLADQPYYALFGGYTSDGGHLNAAGSQHAAAALLGLVARTAGKPRT